MPNQSFPSSDYPADVHTISHDEKTVILIGTAHISQDSVELVEKVISQENPDCVCIELDEKRYQALTQRKKWQSLDLKQIIKDKQLSTLMINILMASYQNLASSQVLNY